MNKYYYDRVNGNCYIRFSDMNINHNLYLFLKYLILILGYGLFFFILQTLVIAYVHGIHKTFTGTILQTILMIISLIYLKYLRTIDFTKVILNTILFVTGNLTTGFRTKREVTIYKVSMDYKFLTHKTKWLYALIFISIISFMIYVFISPVFYPISLELVAMIEYILMYIVFNLFYDKRYYLFLLNLL